MRERGEKYDDDDGSGSEVVTNAYTITISLHLSLIYTHLSLSHTHKKCRVGTVT